MNISPAKKPLTSYSEFCGCSGKLNPIVLNSILKGIKQVSNPNLLVGFDKNDDAGVYLLNHEVALVSTVDLIVSPVDDPHLFGEIAACNALSDVYAMGGKPLFCLNILCIPEEMEIQILKDILKGSLEKITEAGAILIGGHTIRNTTPQYGLAVTGIVSPDRYWRNDQAKVSDFIVLTKPIGTGILFNANKQKRILDSSFNACIKSARTLNKSSAQAMELFKIHAATDITGFGLGGHMFEMAKASNVTIRVDCSKIPVLPEALEMYKTGLTTGITSSNLDLIWPYIHVSNSVPEEFVNMLGDPQTNGGLLVSVPYDQVHELVKELNSLNPGNVEIIGEVCPREEKLLIFN